VISVCVLTEDGSFLKKLGIERKIELPGVGEYLQEQPNTVVAYDSNLKLNGTVPYATFSTAHDLFGDEVSQVKVSTLSKLKGWARQVEAASNGAVKAENVEKLFRIQHHLIFERNLTLGETLTAVSGDFLGCAMWPLLPFSWGSVHLQSVDAINSPAIDPKYFLIDFDLDIQISLGRLAQKFWDTDGVRNFVIQDPNPTLPLNATDEQWATYISNTGESRIFLIISPLCGTINETG
jgi:choline dehydrogenase